MCWILYKKRKPVYTALALIFCLLFTPDRSATRRGDRAKRVVRNGKKDLNTLPLCWTVGTNTVVLATALIRLVILPLLHSWTSFLNVVTLLCCISGTSSIRSRLLAPVIYNEFFLAVLPSNDQHIYDSLLIDEATGISPENL
ncbi:LOW QUALITY PROTEIN: hypothetical protein RJ640_015631 [Escallonia rubra]|uniref:Uncharacterized protein n=1 Tax=Escallonia rubra TaxID=112253 RepID=A0AA88S0S1_9ASTE|nr:LOW QUALITY PROTEIN: hypothetical protein RJ640_015631 [Escallonia rubra]